MPFLLRYQQDSSTPAAADAVRDLLVRAIAPAFAIFLVLVGIGRLLMGPFKSWSEAEDGPNRWAQGLRTPMWDEVTHWWSWIGNTEVAIPICLVFSALIYWSTRQWWQTVIPGLAMALQASVFVAATHVTGRPRPAVAHLDPAPPTSSFPSGHVGAGFALYWTTALFAQRITHPMLRRVCTTILLVIPFLIAWARLYRGMHHLSDILFGAGNGILCVALAWMWLRRGDVRSRAERPRADRPAQAHG